jgi:cell division protein FtsI/penicillin-binding protein 2
MVKMVNLPRGQIGLYVIFPGYDFEGLIRLDGHTPWDNWLAKKVVSSKEDLVFSPLNSLGRAVPLNTFSEWSIREKLLYDITYHAAMFHDNPTEKRVEHVIFNKNGEPVTPKNQMLKLHTVSLKAREIPPEKGKLLAANRQAFPFLTNSDLTDKIFINWPKRQRLPNGQAPANPRATVFRTILVLTQIGVEPIPAFQKAFPSSSRELKQGKWSNIGVYSAPIVILKNGQVDGIYHCEDDASEACAQKLSLRKVAYSLSDPNAVVLEFRYHGQQSETDTGMELFYAGRDSGVAINGLPLRDGDSQKLQWHDRLRLFEGTNVEETQKEWELRCNFGTLNYIEQVISANGYNSSSHSPVDDGELLTRLLGLWDVKSGGLNGLITFTPIRSLLDSGQDLRTTLNSDLIEIAASVTRKHLKMLNQAYPYKEKGPGIPTEHGCSVVILNRQGKIRSLLSFPYLTRADVFREDRVAVDFQNWTTHIRGLNMTKNEYPGSIFKIVTSLCWLLDHNDIDIKPGAPHFTVNNYKEWSIVDGDDVAIPDFKCWQGCATYPAYNSNSIFYAFSLPPTGIRCIGNHQSKSAANPDHMTHLSEILFKSCNQGAMTLWASRSYPGILPGSWIETYKSLGFDVKTGAYEDESYLQFGGRWGRELTKHLDFRPGKLDIAGKTDADFARMSFGQMVELPLIHLALIGEQLLNGGTMYLPRFIASKDEEEEDEAFRWIGFDRNKVDRACRWLAGTLTLGSARVKKPESGRVFYGTSYFSFYQQPDVFAGKTSTVEISTAKDSRSDTKEVDTRPMHLRPHSRWLGWQTGELHDGPNKSFEFVPESTELVIAVSIENSSQPPYKAVDLASKIAGAAMEFYGDFNRKLEQECN